MKDSFLYIIGVEGFCISGVSFGVGILLFQQFLYFYGIWKLSSRVGLGTSGKGYERICK